MTLAVAEALNPNKPNQTKQRHHVVAKRSNGVFTPCQTWSQAA